MCECKPPVAFLSAGARISASSAGPTSGTAIWRGVRDVRSARRRASVSTALPRELDVAVVERRRAHVDLRRAHALLADGAQRLARRASVQGHRHARTDRIGVRTRRSSRAEAVERAFDVAVDAELENLLAEP